MLCWHLVKQREWVAYPGGSKQAEGFHEAGPMVVMLVELFGQRFLNKTAYTGQGLSSLLHLVLYTTREESTITNTTTDTPVSTTGKGVNVDYNTLIVLIVHL